ncbi:hypothetical protein ABZW30_46730 [Kitasatospora sp. NPDC004669]|uniref:hypothetical protein n=1 Tax=Kitasatospora sp. NPDC004669 TaxID=3154555 RepID=UPI0033A3984E
MVGASRSGPWITLPSDGGIPARLHPIRFDKSGVCTSPDAARSLVEFARQATDVFLFSHGWNNDWATANRRYGTFITQFVNSRRLWWTPPDRDYRPLLSGIFWPSTSLVAPWEQTPNIAAAASPAEPVAARDEIAVLAEQLPQNQTERLYELTQCDGLDAARAMELAGLLAPILSQENDELDSTAKPPSPKDLVEAWARTASAGSSATSPDDVGGFIDEQQTIVSAETAGLGHIDPRWAVRITTVLLMKDRAGRVGGRGVAALLRRLVDASPDSRIHLIGHSYGGKVVLSALCSDGSLTRPVDSVLLLQPALSCLCFASDVDSRGRPGGYRPALERTKQPIITTYSRRDMPLTWFFHLAARRASDLGEAVIAGAPPSRYAALGGYGPHGIPDEVSTVDAKHPPDQYDLAAAGTRVVAVQASSAIGGHGDVTNPVTAWALLCQVMR